LTEDGAARAREVRVKNRVMASFIFGAEEMLDRKLVSTG
jgi:hypothetical protein